MFKTRLISGIVLVALMLFFVITGGNLLYFVTLILSIIGMMEFMKMAKIHKKIFDNGIYYFQKLGKIIC